MSKKERIRIKSAKDLICLVVEQLTDNKELKDTILKDYQNKIDLLFSKIKTNEVDNTISALFKLKNNRLYYSKDTFCEKGVVEIIKSGLTNKEKLKNLDHIFEFISTDIRSIVYPHGSKIISDKISSLLELRGTEDYPTLYVHFTDVYTDRYSEIFNDLCVSIKNGIETLIDFDRYFLEEWRIKREKINHAEMEALYGVISSRNFLSIIDILNNLFEKMINLLKEDLKDLQEKLSKIKFN